MTNPGSGGLRVLRGGALAVVCAAVAVCGHVLGGGGVPPLPALVPVAGLVGGAFVVLAGQRRGFVEILLAALVCQPAFHLGFELTSHAHESFVPTAVDLPMVCGHVLASVGVAGLLAYGEDLVWALYSLLAGVRVPRLRLVPVPAVPGTARHDVVELAPIRRRLLARIPPRRGPPVRDSH